MGTKHKEEKAKLSIPSLTSEAINDSRKRVDEVVKMHKEAPLFSKHDFDEALRNVSRRIEKAKPVEESSST